MENVGFTLIGNQIRPKPFDLSSLFHSVVILAMEVQIPIHTVFDVPSLLQAVAADTVLAAAQSIALVSKPSLSLLLSSSHLIFPFNFKFLLCFSKVSKRL